MTVPEGDITATVVRGVGFRYVCECGSRGQRRKKWLQARMDMREHLAEHLHAAPGAPGV